MSRFLPCWWIELLHPPQSLAERPFSRHRFVDDETPPRQAAVLTPGLAAAICACAGTRKQIAMALKIPLRLVNEALGPSKHRRKPK